MLPTSYSGEPPRVILAINQSSPTHGIMAGMRHCNLIQVNSNGSGEMAEEGKTSGASSHCSVPIQTDNRPTIKTHMLRIKMTRTYASKCEWQSVIGGASALSKLRQGAWH